MFLQLLLEALEQGEGIGGGAGETGQYLTVIQAPDLLGVAFSSRCCPVKRRTKNAW